MMRLTPPLLCLALSVMASDVAAAQGSSELRSRRIDELFARFDRSPSPGVAIAVVRDGQVLFRKGYGLASLEHRIPITPSTSFDVASVSKQFTGLAVAMLVEEGRISLRDDIRKYIPELPALAHTITIDHLVHHTSGLRDWPGTLAVGGWRFDDVISFDQILGMAYRQRSLNFVPGAEYTYSNTGYNLLAEMIARVTGQSFRGWTDEHLFRPLGMANTHFRDDHTVVIPNRAFGYARSADSTYRSITNNLTAMGSSSLFSTVDDLARWVMNFDNMTVGGRAAIARTRTRGVLNNGSSIPYAFGVSHGEYRGLPTVSHSGGWASFSTFVVHFPQQRFGVIVLANSGTINAARAAYGVVDVFLETELAAAASANNANATAPVPAIAPATLDDYVGLYRLGPGWYVRITRDGGAMKTQATRESVFPMTPRSDTEFWVAAYGAPIVFARPTAGRVTYLEYRGMRAPKLDDTGARAPARFEELVGDYESDELRTTYRVETRDSALVMRHPRHGSIVLTRLWKDDFASSVWFMKSVEFQRDASGRVVGLLVNVDERSRNIQFARRR